MEHNIPFIVGCTFFDKNTAPALRAYPIQGGENEFPRLLAQDLDNSIINDNLLEANDVIWFKNGRNGDHMMVPFQCDICHFQNLKGQMPVPDSHQDNLLLLCLCRVILDSFWSWERSTVNANRLEGIKFVKIQELLGLGGKGSALPGPVPGGGHLGD